MEFRRSPSVIIPALYCAIVESCCPLFSCRSRWPGHCGISRFVGHRFSACFRSGSARSVWFPNFRTVGFFARIHVAFLSGPSFAFASAFFSDSPDSPESPGFKFCSLIRQLSFSCSLLPSVFAADLHDFDDFDLFDKFWLNFMLFAGLARFFWTCFCEIAFCCFGLLRDFGIRWTLC